MLHPCLIVGVGGSGGRTVRYLWRELERRLERTAWTGGMPRAWRFVHVDCPAKPDVVEKDVPAEVGLNARYFGVGRPDIRYQVYDEKLVVRCPDGYAGWRHEIEKPPLPWLGAGQLRSVGRVVTLDQAQQLRQELSVAAQSFGDPDVQKELAEVNAAMRFNPQAATNAGPMVIVVSSLSGGSGSGAFLDVIELVRSIGSDGKQTAWMRNNLWTLVYAPDVFDNVTPHEGILPNSLAALSELLSAAENDGAPSESDAALLAGGVSQDVGSRLGATTMVVGARNANVGFTSQLDVFRSTGKALASLIANPQANAQFNTYVKTNSSTPNPVLSSFGLGQVGHCSSLGYANVSLGRSLFAEYATERLARTVVDRLLEGNRHGKEAEQRDEVFIPARADQLQDEFINACRLHERGGSDNDQVIDALRAGTDIEAVLSDFERKVTERLATYQEQTEEDARRVVQKEFFSVGATATLEQQRQVLLKNARRWVRDIQPHVVGVVSEYIASEGIQVTEVLLARLATQLEEAADELRDEGDKRRQSADGLKREALTGRLWERVTGRKVTSNNPIFGEVLALARKSTRADIAYEVRITAAELLVELRAGFILPLGRAVHEYLLALRSQTDVHRELVGRWSTSSVPAHLQAAPNELLLEPQSDAPERFEALLKEMFGRDDLNVATTQAIREIVLRAGTRAVAERSGHPLADNAEGACLIRLESAWRPTRLDLREGEASSTAVPTISFGIAEIEHEARSWVRVPSGQISSFVNQTLSGWLESEPNHEVFLSTLERALSSADPLVSIDEELMSRVHKATDVSFSAAITAIPLAPTSKLGARVLEVLTAAGINNPQELFDSNAQADTVEITTTMASAVHPVIFSSLMTPIRLDVAARTAQSLRDEFWFARRARQLRSFVPLSDAMQQAIVRGWLTANLLGQVGVLEGRWSDEPLDIWTADGRMRFPRQLLGRDVRKQQDVLPALFETLPLSLLSFSAGDSTEANAYRRLIELGSGPDGYGSKYSGANPELEDWVVLGRHPEGTAPREEAAGPAAGTMEERKTQLVATFEALAKRFEAETAGPAPIKFGADTGRWELREIVPVEARRLAAAIEQIEGGPTNELAGDVSGQTGL